MDSSGLAAHTDYTPYGERITYGPGHARTSLGYHGEMTDGHGMVYMRARTYDPRLSQFLQRDPMLGAHPNLPASWNPYALAHGNPVNYTDPTGQCLFVCSALVFIGAAALSGAGVYGAWNLFVDQGAGYHEHRTQFRDVDWGMVGTRSSRGAMDGAYAGATAVMLFAGPIAGASVTSTTQSVPWITTFTNSARIAFGGYLGGTYGVNVVTDFVSDGAPQNLNQLGYFVVNGSRGVNAKGAFVNTLTGGLLGTTNRWILDDIIPAGNLGLFSSRAVWYNGKLNPARYKVSEWIVDTIRYNARPFGVLALAGSAATLNSWILTDDDVLNSNLEFGNPLTGTVNGVSAITYQTSNKVDDIITLLLTVGAASYQQVADERNYVYP
ncbi:MAG: RHS repeat-associated core domain-containing protein [Chloroflexota bacterium]